MPSCPLMQEDSQKRTGLGQMRVVEFWATAAEGFVLEWTLLMRAQEFVPSNSGMRAPAASVKKFYLL